LIKKVKSSSTLISKLNSNAINLICGETTSQFGKMIFSIFSMWTAYAITQNQWYVGIIGALQLISTLINPLGGILADRFNKRVLLLSIDIFRCIILLLCSLLFYLGYNNFLILAITVCLLSLGSGIFAATFDAIVPEYISRDQLLKVNGIMTTFFQAATIVGASAGGAIVLVSDLYWAPLLNAITFFISVIFILRLPRLGNEEQFLTKMKDQNNFLKLFLEGLSYIRHNKFIINVIPVALVVNLSFWTIWALLPKWTSVFFNNNSFYYSALEICLSIGAILGGALLGILNKKFNKLGLVFIIGTILQGITLVIFSLSHISILSISLWFLYGFFNTIGSSVYFTALQMMVPQKLLGRVMGTITTIFSITSPLGAMLSGVLNSMIRIEYLVFACALLMTLSSIGLFLIKDVVRLTANGLKDSIT